MSCKCFTTIPKFAQNLTFAERLDKSKCRCNARFVVSEKKSRFEVLSCSLDEIDKYKVDGYLYQDKTRKRCDYCFNYHSGNNQTICIFVELKGVAIETAVQQIDSTIEDFEKNNYFKTVTSTKVICAIVSTGYPSDDSTYKRLVKTLKTKYKRLNPIVERKKFDLRYNPKTGECFGKGE